jgi:beta-lactamase class A
MIQGWVGKRVLQQFLLRPEMSLIARRLTIIAALLVAPSVAGAQRADTIPLHRTLDSLSHHFHGVLGYSIDNLDTGERLTRRGDETFPTASLIKVAILVTLYDLVDKGMVSLDDQLTLLKIDQVPGSGVLQYMHPGMTLTVRDAAVLMSILSDNTATNLLLDKIVIRRVWQKMEALGLPHTKVHSKVFLRIASVAVDSSVKYGLGVTTPNEMARLFEMMANGKAVSPKADSAMLDVLANNQDMELMQRTISGLAVPHKTGATDSVRTECALFRLQSRVVACALTTQNTDTRWVVDNEAQLALGKIGEAILRTWPKKQERADDSR